jgi:hypothetical protein
MSFISALVGEVSSGYVIIDLSPFFHSHTSHRNMVFGFSKTQDGSSSNSAPLQGTQDGADSKRNLNKPLYEPNVQLLMSSFLIPSLAT